MQNCIVSQLETYCPHLQLWGTQFVPGTLRLMNSAATSALNLPTSLFLKRNWRFRLEMSIVSMSITSMFLKSHQAWTISQFHINDTTHRYLEGQWLLSVLSNAPLGRIEDFLIARVIRRVTKKSPLGSVSSSEGLFISVRTTELKTHLQASVDRVPLRLRISPLWKSGKERNCVSVHTWNPSVPGL